MSRVSVPHGCTLAAGMKPPKKKHAWTVADVIDMLREYPDDAIVWRKAKSGGDVVEPLESLYGSNGHVIF